MPTFNPAGFSGGGGGGGGPRGPRGGHPGDYLQAGPGLTLLAALDAFGDVRVTLAACATASTNGAANGAANGTTVKPASLMPASKAVYARIGATHASGVR